MSEHTISSTDNEPKTPDPIRAFAVASYLFMGAVVLTLLGNWLVRVPNLMNPRLALTGVAIVFLYLGFMVLIDRENGGSDG